MKSEYIINQSLYCLEINEKPFRGLKVPTLVSESVTFQ